MKYTAEAEGFPIEDVMAEPGGGVMESGESSGVYKEQAAAHAQQAIVAGIREAAKQEGYKEGYNRGRKDGRLSAQREMLYWVSDALGSL